MARHVFGKCIEVDDNKVVIAIDSFEERNLASVHIDEGNACDPQER